MIQKPTTTSHFNFHNLYPHLFIGTARDRYASWLGQIYTPEKYEGRITSRLKNLETNSYIEEVLPIDTQEYLILTRRIAEKTYQIYVNW